jgi:MoaA/NifB/PqqE/SkfB family radical SAM enzyme
MQRKIHAITLIITTRCNFKCIHCLREYYKNQYDLSFDLLKKVLIDAKSKGFNHLGLTGGEPILYPNFNEFVEWIVNNGFTWSVTTNASMYKLYEKPIKLSENKLGIIRISFDGATEKTHDHIREKGSFKKLFEATKYFQKLGVKVVFGYTVNSKNIDEIPLMVELAKKYKVHALGFGGIIPTGYNLNLQITGEQKLNLYKYIQKIRKENLFFEIVYSNSLYALTNADKFCKLINKHKPAINAYGDYIFCCDTIGQGAVLGSLKEESFQSLYQKGIEKARWLKEERKRRIKNKLFFKGFNSCHYCNLMLEKQIKKHKKYNSKNQLLSLDEIIKII